MKYIQSILVLLFFSLEVLAHDPSRGSLCNPNPQIFIQPDNTLVELTFKGDAVINWYQSVNGFTVLRDIEGDFKYAIQNEEGDLVPSNFIVTDEPHKDVHKLEHLGIKTDLRYSASQIKEKEGASFHVDYDKSTQVDGKFPTTGVRNVLVILAEFADEKATINADLYDSIMNQEGYNGTGSFRDYYLENSYGKLDLRTTVVGWVTLPNDKAFYGGNNSNDDDSNPRSFVRDAIEGAEKKGVDFSKFDNDGDGEVEGIIVMHAGHGEESGGCDDCIWSHRWNLAHLAQNFDGVEISEYSVFPELSGKSGSNPINIGVICHEFGHVLGLPDYYDTDYAGSGGQAFDIGTWDLMAGGSWNNGGATPAGCNAYSKVLLGWIDPDTLRVKRDIQLYASNDSAYACLIETDDEDEFYIIENRQQRGFDQYVPTHGMLIFHVDLDKWRGNSINVDPDHQGFDLIEADGIPTDETISGDPFPGKNLVQHFTNDTDPGMITWSGELLNKPINNIVEDINGNVFFKFKYTEDELNELNKVTIYVNDGKTPLRNATVTLEGISLYTNDKGKVVFYIDDSENVEFTIMYNENLVFSETILSVTANKTLIKTVDPNNVDDFKNIYKTFKAYPTITESYLFVESLGNKSIYVDVFSVTGTRVLSNIEVNSLKRIDVTQLKNGIYFVTDTRQNSIKQKFIKH